jgi:hypothetical protein
MVDAAVNTCRTELSPKPCFGNLDRLGVRSLVTVFIRQLMGMQLSGRRRLFCRSPYRQNGVSVAGFVTQDSIFRTLKSGTLRTSKANSHNTCYLKFLLPNVFSLPTCQASFESDREGLHNILDDALFMGTACGAQQGNLSPRMRNDENDLLVLRLPSLIFRLRVLWTLCLMHI